MTLYDATGAPPWMLDPTTNFGQVTFTTRIAGDANIEKLDQGVHAAMPGLGTPTADAYLGADMVLLRGPNETDDQYEGRLSAGYDTWDAAGTARAVLEQLYWFVSYDPGLAYPVQVPILAIVKRNDSRSTWHTLYSGGDPTAPVYARTIGAGGWLWDGLQYGRRAWLVLYYPPLAGTGSGAAASITANTNDLCTVTGLTNMTSANVGQYLELSGAASSVNNGLFQIVAVASASSVTAAILGGVAGDANNGAIAWQIMRFPATAPGPVAGCPGLRADGNTSAMLGEYANAVITAALTNPPDFVGMQALVREWKSASTWYPWFIFCFGGGTGVAGDEFSPNSTTTTGNPNGTWLTWAKPVFGQMVYARYTGVQGGYLDAFCDGTTTYSNCSVPTGT